MSIKGTSVKMRNVLVLGAVLAVLGCAVAMTRPLPDPRLDRWGVKDIDPSIAMQTPDPGCASTTLVSTGGTFPKDPQTLAIRWTGFANFELAYNGQIILLDAYFDRGSVFPPLGFKAADVKRADLLLLGHGHVDHMSDAASVGMRTGALIVGAPVTTEKLLTQGVDPNKVRMVHGRGGELLKFNGFTVEPILGRHGEPPPHVVEAFQKALQQTTTPPTQEQRAELMAIRARGTADKRVIHEGTIAYLITFDNGFRVLYRDSGGIVTEYEKAAMDNVGGVDVALVAVSASVLNTLTAQRALEHVRAYRPAVYIPNHHDASFNTLWRATEPLFQAMKDENPKLITVSKGYREPVCFNTEYNLQRQRK
jgi:L-ascorbate metabolism protein UlaG (beta-lactamase superfamily)